MSNEKNIVQKQQDKLTLLSDTHDDVKILLDTHILLWYA